MRALRQLPHPRGLHAVRADASGLLRLDEQVLRSLDEISRQHRPFVDAIDAGDEELAARLLNEHAEHAGELIAGLLASND